MSSAVLLIHCPDKSGLVASVSDFLARYHGNILHFDQHVDAESQVFFMRAEWELDGFQLNKEEIGTQFELQIASRFDMKWELFFSEERPRMGLFVSQLSHCLFDILSRHEANELAVDIPFILSNHTSLEPVARRFEIPFFHVPNSKDIKQNAEKTILELVHLHKIDFMVLARYMQILSAEFVEQFPNRIINIHHSFLPAFPGAKPYHSAHQRGVKIIGATSHYVTSDLDAGPIIEQDIVRVTHKDSIDDLVLKGRDLEKLVLSRAIRHHINRKILVYGNKTVVF
ncbi:formyltetrahydrofolate deformylase [bacterium]|nr:MAG: formyltetrahydrofolate deformylase [bacterium]